MELTRLQVLQQATSQSYLKDRKPSQEELQAEYELQVGTMAKTQYRASHILVPTQAAAQKIIDELARARRSRRSHRRISTDAGSKDQGGDLDWFSPEGMTPPFAKAVASNEERRNHEGAGADPVRLACDQAGRHARDRTTAARFGEGSPGADCRGQEVQGLHRQSRQPGQDREDPEATPAQLRRAAATPAAAQHCLPRCRWQRAALAAPAKAP